jgi:dephospho-CoA kinase
MVLDIMSLEKAPSTYGLTGGMGSGKSTVSAILTEKGAVIVDADQIVHDLQRPGQPALLGMAAILGEGILTESGELDRAAAGREMFGDDERKRAVEALFHPLVWGKIRDSISAAKPMDKVILDVPLLETKPDDIQIQGTLVVDTETDLAVSRLVQHRGFSEEAARQRIAQQLAREERLAAADYIITNNGSREELLQGVEAAWRWMAAPSFPEATRSKTPRSNRS